MEDFSWVHQHPVAPPVDKVDQDGQRLTIEGKNTSGGKVMEPR